MVCVFLPMLTNPGGNLGIKELAASTRLLDLHAALPPWLIQLTWVYEVFGESGPNQLLGGLLLHLASASPVLGIGQSALLGPDPTGLYLLGILLRDASRLNADLAFLLSNST